MLQVVVQLPLSAIPFRSSQGRVVEDNKDCSLKGFLSIARDNKPSARMRSEGYDSWSVDAYSGTTGYEAAH